MPATTKRPAVQPAAFSPTQSAQYLGVSRATVDRLRAEGKLASFRVRGQVRIRKVVLDQYMEEREAM